MFLTFYFHYKFITCFMHLWLGFLKLMIKWTYFGSIGTRHCDNVSNVFLSLQAYYMFQASVVRTFETDDQLDLLRFDWNMVISIVSAN